MRSTFRSGLSARERMEREEERRAGELDAEGGGEAEEEHRLFLPIPPFMALAKSD